MPLSDAVRSGEKPKQVLVIVSTSFSALHFNYVHLLWVSISLLEICLCPLWFDSSDFFGFGCMTLFENLSKSSLILLTEAYHPEAFNFPYTFETMLPIIPDQWKSLLQFLPK